MPSVDRCTGPPQWAVWAVPSLPRDRAAFAARPTTPRGCSTTGRRRPRLSRRSTLNLVSEPTVCRSTGAIGAARRQPEVDDHFTGTDGATVRDSGVRPLPESRTLQSFTDRVCLPGLATSELAVRLSSAAGVLAAGARRIPSGRIRRLQSLLLIILGLATRVFAGARRPSLARNSRIGASDLHLNGVVRLLTRPSCAAQSDAAGGSEADECLPYWHRAPRLSGVWQRLQGRGVAG